MLYTEISIRLPYEDCIHTHKVEIPYKDNEEPLAEDVLKQVILLMENVYGETATRDAIEKL
ncbi:MAG: hypothetical protein J6R25_07045 [Bacteroidales bacterium]|nr:hypothetical protein [Bacteroidales bacterium]